MPRVLWRSWTPEWTAFEVPRIRAIGLNWFNGDTTTPEPDDIMLTCNGQNFPEDHKGKKASFFAECYHYNVSEYEKFATDNKWDARIIFWPLLREFPKTHLITLPGYWASDGKGEFYGRCRRMFSMVLTKRHRALSLCDNFEIRNQFVFALNKCANGDFIYWGRGWHPSDSNYFGTFDRHGFDKHIATRPLWAMGKFPLALDTSKNDGFITEKFWHALASGGVPVYSGPRCIKDRVPERAFIYADDFPSVDDVIEFCYEMPYSEWEERRAVGRAFWLQDTDHSWETGFKRIDRILQRL